MNLTNKLALPILSTALLASNIRGDVYDSFGSGTLNPSLWTVQQDLEGQPLTDEYGVQSENGNFVFHTQQNIIGDRRTYLRPTRTFTTGDIFEWDTNVQSREGNYGTMVLLTGDQYIRIGINGFNNGVQGYDEIGTSRTRFYFDENNLVISRESPSGLNLVDTLPLNNQDGTYSLYVGTFTGHNGRAHIDFDNFQVSIIPSSSTACVLGLCGILAGARLTRKRNP